VAYPSQPHRREARYSAGRAARNPDARRRRHPESLGAVAGSEAIRNAAGQI